MVLVVRPYVHHIYSEARDEINISPPNLFEVSLLCSPMNKHTATKKIDVPRATFLLFEPSQIPNPIFNDIR